MDELIGKRMGPYTITERIGDGGMAIVYRAYQESLNRYVALKVLRDELARDQQFVARFRQEALGAANLDHPNIVHVYDAGAANGKYFIAMAYVDGGDLKGLIHQGAVDPERAVSITIQLAEALDHAHKQGLIHRDVKPSNVLMTRDGRPLLTDFGIAKALYEARQLTRTGTSIGTPEYMAPEQAQGLPPDGRTDIYALGVVLYEMLAAKVPFCTDTPVATMYMHVHEPPPSLRQVQGAVPEWLENVVCKALAKNPDDRYATAGLFAAALRQGQDSMRAAAWAATSAPDAPTAIGPAVAAAGAAAAAARQATPSSDLPTAVGPTAAASGAQRPPTPPSDLPTAVGPSAAQGTPTPAEAIAAVGAAGAAATPAPVERKRPKALVPILIAAIALLVVVTSVSAALLLGGGGSDDTPDFVTQVIIGEDQPTEALGGAVDEATDTPTATDEVSATPTTTVTPSPTPTGTPTRTPTASPTTSATASPTTTPTPSRTPTRTPTVAPTATNTPAPTDTQPPPPTDTPPPPPPPTDTPPPPTDTTEPPTKPPPPSPTNPPPP